jgi:hypothetical protein
MANRALYMVEQVLPFLRDSNQQVRFAALQALVGHSTEGSPGREIFFEPSTQGSPSVSSVGVIADLKVLCRDSSVC